MKLSDELRMKLAALKNAAEELVKNDAATLEQVEAKGVEIATMEAKLKMQLGAEAGEEPSAGGTPVKPIDGADPVDTKAVYEDAFYNALAGRPLTEAQGKSLAQVNNALSSGTGEDGGYLIPADQQVAIRELKRQYDSLEELVTVEPVATLTGNRNMEKDAQYTPFAEFSEGDTLADTDTPQFVNIAYTIKDRGGILPIPNNLLADNKANLQAYLNRWLAMKSVATRNKLIIDLLNTKAKTALTDVDSVKNVLNVTLDPAISSMSTVVMNQDAFNAFDKMKDSDGNYLLEKDPQNPTRKLLAGRPIKVVSNKTLPTIVTGTGETEVKKAPVIIGSLKEAIVLFDRQQMSLLATNIGGTSFAKNRTEVRAIEREDVKGFDFSAIVFGEIKVQ